MKFSEANVGSKAEFADYIKKIIPDLFAGRLAVEGKAVTIPADTNLDYKVKFDESDEGGSVSIKVSWENPNLDLEIEEE